MHALLHYFHAGGPLMWPILGLSILSWAIIIERALGLRRGRLINLAVMEPVRQKLAAGDVAGALATVQPGASVLDVILADGLDEHLHARADIDSALQGAAERRLHPLWDNMLSLNTIARVATMLGLFGTVVGMVQGFEQLSQAGVAKEKLAEAIGIALITTVGGLMVAIPAVIAESAFRSRIRDLMLEFEEILVTVVRSARVGAHRDARP
ncbi:MAG: MotA/TolQ/ExbB proton channel family protein [Lentisphaerae bacterium]|nr:MotA/TolQ/ExbB proton channel family protein [Lentisphaerota bacterium]